MSASETITSLSIITSQVYSKTQFFVEDDIYWAPASTTSDLYSQLASKKYREISRDQIKWVHCVYVYQHAGTHHALWMVNENDYQSRLLPWGTIITSNLTTSDNILILYSKATINNN